MEVVNMKSSNINYIWSGPLADKEEASTAAAIWAAKQTNNPIIFHCKEEFKNSFENYFAEKNVSHIQVRSFEEQLTSTEDEYVQQAQQAYDCLKQQENLQENRIRVLVSEKNLFASFLNYKNAGYVLDANVFVTHNLPTRREEDARGISEEKITVPPPEELDETSSQYVRSAFCRLGKMVDCWLTFSDDKTNKFFSGKALKALSCDLLKVKSLKRHEHHSDSVINALQISTNHLLKNAQEEQPNDIPAESYTGYITVDENQQATNKTSNWKTTFFCKRMDNSHGRGVKELVGGHIDPIDLSDDDLQPFDL